MNWPEGENADEEPHHHIPQRHYELFHSIDRALYTILAIHLGRDPAESLHVVALLLWLERTGFPNAVKTVLSLPQMLVGDLADEAMACLNFLFNHHTSNFSADGGGGGADIPLMRGVLGRRISARFLHENREDACQVMSKIIDTVCVRALADIMQDAVARRKNTRRHDPVHLPDRPVFPGMQLHRKKDQNARPVGPPNRKFWFDRRAEEAEAAVPPDDRTLFVTFSKGYPVQEWEVREFLTAAFGDCVEAVHMQEVQAASEQPLFARVVFRSAAMIEQVLDASGKAKFVINGKHVWARKFVPKRSNSTHRTAPVHHHQPSPPPQPHNNLPPPYFLFS